jgi:acetyltransferase-like isoleucine patch superfamily enzyme
LGDDVSIGANVILLKGSQIGNRSIVGAVVTEPVPDDCVCAGNPARLVKRLLREKRILSY